MHIIKNFQLPEDETHWPARNREACRSVLLNKENKMALLHILYGNYYKLPWWWIESWEERDIALAREMQEETGCKVSMLKELGAVVEQNSTRKQTSYCYEMKVDEEGVPHFTQDELNEWFSLVWVYPEEAVKLLQNTKPTWDTQQRIRQRDYFILQYYMTRELKPWTYQHYKGWLYQLIGVARHSETLEEMVVYRALYDSEEFWDNSLRARPKAMFLENVLIDWEEKPRFLYIWE